MTNNRIVSSYLDGFNGSDEILLVGPMPADRLAITEPVIFVDGGSNRREKTIGLSVGDGDSANQPMDIRLNPEKDFSDLFRVLPNEHLF